MKCPFCGRPMPEDEVTGARCSVCGASFDATKLQQVKMQQVQDKKSMWIRLGLATLTLSIFIALFVVLCILSNRHPLLYTYKYIGIVGLVFLPMGIYNLFATESLIITVQEKTHGCNFFLFWLFLPLGLIFIRWGQNNMRQARGTGIIVLIISFLIIVLLLIRAARLLAVL